MDGVKESATAAESIEYKEANEGTKSGGRWALPSNDDQTRRTSSPVAYEVNCVCIASEVSGGVSGASRMPPDRAIATGPDALVKVTRTL